jgi:predicted ester cyclase
MSEENKVVVRQFFEELLSKDNLAVADELLSPDFRFYFAGSPDPMNLERYKEFLVARRATFPNRRFAVEDMIAEGDKVSARFTMRGTHAPSAREVSMTGIDMIRLAEEDGGGSGRGGPVRNDAAARYHTLSRGAGPSLRSL